VLKAIKNFKFIITEEVLSAKPDTLRTLTDRLKLLHEHDALYLLKNCMAIPKLMYFLRTAPCFLNPDLLAQYDETIKTGLENILNVKITDPVWDQVSLPTKLGGFGIKKPLSWLSQGTYPPCLL
jgi:hypothetical protein